MGEFSTIFDLIKKHSRPDDIAVICGGNSLTYRQLIGCSLRVARALVRDGLGKGDRVVMQMQPGHEAMITLYGILLAGGVYVPVDPEWPDERRQYVYGDCGAVTAVTESIFRKLMDMDCDAALPQLCGEDECCIYYTSGSTGRPKGAVTVHQVISNMCESFEFGTPDRENVPGEDHVCRRVLSIFNPVFAATTTEYFEVLSQGNTLVIATEDEKLSASALAGCMERNGIDVFCGTPSQILRYLEDESFARSFRKLKTVRFMGEKMSDGSLQDLISLTDGAVHGYYGTSETLLCSKCDYTETGGNSIGSPLLGDELYVLGNDMEDVRAGEIGELYIGGVPARYGHYINLPELDAEKYIAHPVYGRLFRTGDGAILNRDGSITVTGRIDGVIKLHGQRIDPLDIEGLMEIFEGINRAVVRLQGEAESAVLAAYYTGRTDEDMLRRYLADRLPYYMVPAQMMHLDDMPLNANGKIDRSKLPEIEKDQRQGIYEEPRTEDEKLLCRVIEDVLKPGRAVGINDSFFGLGGDSFAAMSVISALKGLDRQLKLQWIFAVPSIRELAAMMMSAEGSEANKASEGWRYTLSDEDRDIIYTKVPPEDICDIYPLTSEYEYFYTHTVSEEDFVISQCLMLNGSPDVEALRARFDELLQKRQYLRGTIVTAGGGRPFIVVLREARERMAYADIRSLTGGASAFSLITEEQKEHIRKIDSLYNSKGFLEGEPLIHAVLLRISDECCVLYTRCSHYIADNTTNVRMLNELLDPYREIESDDMLMREYNRRIHDGSNIEEAGRYWQDLLQGCGGLSRLPGTGDRAMSGESDSMFVMLDPVQRRMIERYCGSQNISAAALMHYSLGEVLTEELGSDKAVYYNIGDGRSEYLTDDPQVTGMFSVRSPFVYHKGDTMHDCQQQLLKSKRYEWLDLDRIGPEYDNTNLFQNVVTLDIVPNPVNIGKNAHHIFVVKTGWNDFILMKRQLNIYVTGETDYRIVFCFDPGIYDRNMIQRMAYSFSKRLLDAAASLSGR